MYTTLENNILDTYTNTRLVKKIQSSLDESENRLEAATKRIELLEGNNKLRSAC